MTHLTTHLIELIQQGSEMAGVLDLPAKHWPRPGQYLACQRVAGDGEPLAVNLFRIFGYSDQLTVAPIPPGWQPGDGFDCTGPLGRGFNPPDHARRVGLIPYAVSPFRLLCLVNNSLPPGAVVALFSDKVLPPDVLSWMPSQVEVLPLAELAGNPHWPEYLAIDLDRSAMDRFDEFFTPLPVDCAGEVLVHTPMPCRGVGACGVCAVHTRRGWRFACEDGPVFPMAEVFNVAR